MEGRFLRRRRRKRLRLPSTSRRRCHTSPVRPKKGAFGEAICSRAKSKVRSDPVGGDEGRKEGRASTRAGEIEGRIASAPAPDGGGGGATCSFEAPFLFSTATQPPSLFPLSRPASASSLSHQISNRHPRPRRQEQPPRLRREAAPLSRRIEARPRLRLEGGLRAPRPAAAAGPPPGRRRRGRFCRADPGGHR